MAQLSRNGGTVKIGVLGGIGPEATGEFYTKLIKGIQESGVSSNVDFPNIIVNSIPAPELVDRRTTEEALKPYIDGLKVLDSMNPDFIVMVCNTIHVFLKRLQKEVKAPILDLREAARSELEGLGISSMLVFGTPTTTAQGLYEFENITSFVPNSKENKFISKAIVDFNVGKLSEKQHEGLRRICRKYIGVGAKSVLLSCTELSLILANEDFPKVSTLDVLVSATVQKFLEVDGMARGLRNKA